MADSSSPRNTANGNTVPPEEGLTPLTKIRANLSTTTDNDNNNDETYKQKVVLIATGSFCPGKYHYNILAE